MKDEITLWTADDRHIELVTDGRVFRCRIRAGIEGETYYEVAYSAPNYAIETDSTPEYINFFIGKIAPAVQAKYEELQWPELAGKECLLPLYELCKEANRIYNNWLQTSEEIALRPDNRI